MLHHLILIKFKEGVSEDRRMELKNRLEALPGIIPEIRSYHVGFDVVRSERSCDLAIASTFDDLDALERYRVHPAHQEVVKLLREISSSTVAADFIA